MLKSDQQFQQRSQNTKHDWHTVDFSTTGKSPSLRSAIVMTDRYYQSRVPVWSQARYQVVQTVDEVERQLSSQRRFIRVTAKINRDLVTVLLPVNGIVGVYQLSDKH